MKLTFDNLKKLKSGSNKNHSWWTIDHMQILMNQVTWALLIIFVIAFVLSDQSTKMQLKGAKEQIEKDQTVIKGLLDTEKGEAYVKLVSTLEELQRQKLINALDEFEKSERDKMFISSYLTNGLINLDNVLDGEKIKDQNFINGCNYAKERFSDYNNLKQDWLDSVLDKAQMNIPSEDQKNTNIDPDNISLVTKNNVKFLFEQINIRIKSVRSDVKELQNKMLSLIQEHFIGLVDQGNSSFLSGTEAEKILKRYSEATEEEKRQLPAIVSASIRELIRKIVQDSKLNLLPSSN